VELRHRLLLRDSHASLLRDPAFVTNKTDSFQGVIDYIWCRKQPQTTRAHFNLFSV
jgi:mRNA deadenylase 3'-5' endonuclease subunit Ccr4